MKGKMVSGILIILILSGLLASVLGVSTVESSNGVGTTDNSSLGTLRFAYDQSGNERGKNAVQTGVVRHKMHERELARLKHEIGVWESGQDYNQPVAGHGTGLAPPTEEEWMRIRETSSIVDEVILNQMTDAPSSVDHTAGPYFPPIGNQDGEGSCTAWAIGYYTKTFQEASEHNWDLSEADWEGGDFGHPTPAYQNRIFSPDFLYHLINGGVDGGSAPYWAGQVVATIGVSSYEQMPYDPSDHTGWPSEAAWSEASLYRGNSSGLEYMWVDTDEGLTNLKNWLASDHLAVIGVDANLYVGLTVDDLWTLNNYNGAVPNHANTIVGYDDNLGYVEAGEYRNGAFKIANSWGVGGWMGWENVPDGCYWISYEAMKQRVEYCMFFRDMTGYEPQLVASFRVAHPKRAECTITVGIGDQTSPLQTKRFNVYGGDHPFCPNNILLDVTEFQDAVPTVYNQSYFLEVYDGGSTDTGTISQFAVEYANSPTTPLDTINSQYVYANATLSLLETSWTDETLVGLDEDFIDGKISMATDNIGHLYVAYADWYTAVNQSAVFVRQSTDDGDTWSTLGVGYDSIHNMLHPSIAIDPYSNDIFVAVEREWTSSDHDIFVLRCVSNIWDWSPVATVLGSDDRFPSITSEYSYGEDNSQYISYEYVYTYNDRDLMFAKSTDHGATWSVKKLHGGWPDYNVHAQTSITNAEGYVYIAYKWGADYNSACEIRVDRSTNFGNSWSQSADIDGLPNSCSSPSIAATHGSGDVAVAFQYKQSPDNIDVWYSCSIDRGTTWIKGNSLFALEFEDETLPALTADGGGTTSNNVGNRFHAVCKAGSYVNYRRASNPVSWTNLQYVSDRCVGKGLTISTQPSGEQFRACVAWTDERTRNIYYSWTLSPIFIRVDGSIDPPTAPISSVDNVTYTLTACMHVEVFLSNVIVVEKDDIIIDGAGHALKWTGPIDVYIRGCGIRLTNRNNVTVKNVRIEGLDTGLSLNGSTSNIISNNNITSNLSCGMYLRNSPNNTISGNIISYIGFEDYGDGVVLWSSSNNSIFGNAIERVRITSSSNNTIWDNEISGGYETGGPIIAALQLGGDNNLVYHNRFRGAAGINIWGSHNYVFENDMYYGIRGIGLFSATNNTIRGNNLTDFWVGLALENSEHNSIVGNNIKGCEGEWEGGITLHLSSDNIIAGNELIDNLNGVCLSNASDNLFYHNNFINNTDHVYDLSSHFGSIPPSFNVWDHGYPSGGNYWSDYSDLDDYHGEHQDVPGSDEIWDGPYEIDVDNQDRYPLTEPWEPPKILGDIDGDDDVDIYDLSLAGKSYGCTCSHPGYNRQADITCDGRVDIRDIAIIGRHWGQVAP